MGRVDRLSFFAKTSPTPPIDKRGKHANPNAMSDETVRRIHQHIKSFPAIESHYGRGSTSKKYLSSHLSVVKMHEMYMEAFEPEEYSKLEAGEVPTPAVSYEFYRKYFNTHFNLSFGVPKTDTCSKCDELNVQINDATIPTEKQKFQEEKREHLHLAQEFYAEMRTSTEMSRENENIACFAFDFQQNLPLPHIPTNDIFYLRQLWVYVFGIHDCASNNAHMYVWPENTAGRGSSEVVSCLNHYFENLVGIDTVVLFSDSCGGQNKNSTVIQYLYTLVKLGKFKCIRHVFPIRGHSFLPCDRDFAKTESKKRRIERLYTPDHWMQVIRTARKAKPFTVVQVSQDMVLDFPTHFSQFFKKTVVSGGERMRIRDARMFEYSSDHPNEVWVKYSLSGNDEWGKFVIEKKRSGPPSLPSEKLYSGTLSLNPNKVDDLKKVVYKFVPREFRDFYDEIIMANVSSPSTSSQTQD